ncbi:golgin subfamily member [Salix suchowensis]|nr:golgin subfamily member [Salix suchowensis]
MKKLFFFKSSSSNDGNNNTSSPLSADKQVYWEVPLEGEPNDQDNDIAQCNFWSPRGLFSKSGKQTYDSQIPSNSSGLRRSRSLSSAAFLDDGMGHMNFSCINDETISSSSSSSCAHQQHDHSSRRCNLTPERRAKTKRFGVAATRLERSGHSKSHYDSSGYSSSSNVSSKIVDRYIDGEQEQEMSKPRNCSQRNFTGSGNAGGRLPPRVQYTAPASPTDNVKDKPRSHSFREYRGTRQKFSSRNWVDKGFGHESPQKLARSVMERLSQSRAYPKSSLKQYDRDIPITIEDVYGGSANSYMDVPARKSYSLEEPCETINSYNGEDLSGFEIQNYFPGHDFGDMNSVGSDDMVGVELQRRSKEAEERIALLSEELEQESFLQDSGFDVPLLMQTIQSLIEDKISLAIEVSGLLKSRIADRDSAKEGFRLAKAEWEARNRRLEKEKTELQTALEKELDRRSSDWSSKLEKYQLEEQRLRERVRELAEHNVSLQREVSSFSEREAENKSVITYSEQQLRHLTSKVEEVSDENRDLKHNISDLQNKYAVAEEDLDCIKRNFEEKNKECKDLQKSITRLLRTCSDQERTIGGLRGKFSEDIEKRTSLDKFDNHVTQMQMEQMRLTGVELTLRREVESYRLEIDSLRHENINLLKRLKGSGEEIGALTFKLDKEIWTRVCYLQNQGLSLLNESTQLSAKLLEYIKGKMGHFQEIKQGMEFLGNGLDGQFIVESDMKVQGFKRGTESLTRSLQTISSLLQEKSNPGASKSHSPSSNDIGSEKLNHTPEESLRFELKAETLLTRLLREKLYFKESEVEQLQAEIAAAVRGNDILRCEVGNTLDNLACVSHQLKNLDLQMLKKDENLDRLQSDLQASAKELTSIRGVLAKVSQERDMMWEEVKQYKEQDMLLNSEINVLKKKIEALDEDSLLKEGQITILKDTLGNRPFDLLGSPNCTREFLLE